MMTRQEIFDKAYIGVSKQGRPSVNEYGGCVYRGAKGAKCAFGWLIPDGLFEPAMEGKFAYALLEEFPKVREMFSVDDLRLIRDMQIAHDEVSHESNFASASSHKANFVEAFQRRMASVANHYGLTVPTLEETAS